MSSILVNEGELAQMTAEHYLTARKLADCQRELAEARAALEEVEDLFLGWLVLDQEDVQDWKMRHAAAIKAAREET
jgi:hypothetical protein